MYFLKWNSYFTCYCSFFTFHDNNEKFMNYNDKKQKTRKIETNKYVAIYTKQKLKLLQNLFIWGRFTSNKVYLKICYVIFREN